MKHSNLFRILVGVGSFVALLVLGQNCSQFEGKPAAAPGLEFNFNQFGIASANSPGGYQNLTPDGCNSTSYAQDPRDPGLLWGRMLHYSGLPGEDHAKICTWIHFEIGTFRLDAAASRIRYVKPALTLPLRLADGRRITTAYDVSIVDVGGERWISFECAGDEGFAGSVGACMGPVDADNNLIASRTVVVVDGVAASGDRNVNPSASVPKLFLENGQLHLFWSQVRVTPQGQFLSVKTWGAKLERSQTNGSYWLAGTNSAQPSDSSFAQQVFGVTGPAMADVSEVYGGKDYWLVTSHVGGSTCVVPDANIPSCYVMRVGWVQKGIHRGAFDQQRALPGLPAGSENWMVQYPRILRDSKGQAALLVNVVGEATMRLIPISLVEPAAIAPRQKLVTQLFSRLLNRGVDQIAIVATTSMNCANIGKFVADSPEANGRYASLGHADFVRLLYTGLLNREPDAGGRQNYVNALSAGTLSRADVVNAFARSAEFGNVCREAGVPL